MKVAVYGTLRHGASANSFLNTSTHLGKDKIVGELYHLGAYPGLRLSEEAEEGVREIKEVVVDVYEVTPEVLARLDRYEGYHEGFPDQSLYLRVEVKTLNLEETVQVYEYNALPRNLTPIKSGDWFNV